MTRVDPVVELLAELSVLPAELPATDMLAELELATFVRLLAACRCWRPTS